MKSNCKSLFSLFSSLLLLSLFGVTLARKGQFVSLKASSDYFACEDDIKNVNDGLDQTDSILQSQLKDSSFSREVVVYLKQASDKVKQSKLYLKKYDIQRVKRRVAFLRNDFNFLASNLPQNLQWICDLKTLQSTMLTQMKLIEKRCYKAPPLVSSSSNHPTTTQSPPVNPSPPKSPSTIPSPPKPTSAASLNTITNTSNTDYEALGLPPYGSGDEWSGPIHATWYGNEEGTDTYGACYGTLPEANELLGVYTAAGSLVVLQKGAECGACYQIQCADERLCISNSPVTIHLTNACPKSNGKGYPWCDFPRIHFDMSRPAFAQMAELKVGALRVNYRRVDCPTVSGIGFHIRNESNPYWIQVTILNVGGPGSVEKLWVRGTKSIDWYPVNRSWGSNWSIHGKPGLLGQAVSFKIQGKGTDQVVISQDVLPSGWTFGQTYFGGQWDAASPDSNNPV